MAVSSMHGHGRALPLQRAVKPVRQAWELQGGRGMSALPGSAAQEECCSTGGHPLRIGFRVFRGRAHRGVRVDGHAPLQRLPPWNPQS